MPNVRDDLKAIYTAAINAVNPATAVESHVRVVDNTMTLLASGSPYKEFNLDRFRRVIVVGAGKATASMARAVEGLLGDRIATGCVCVKYGYTDTLSKIEMIEAAHPVPDAAGTAGAARILSLLGDAREDDLVVSLISGGGSALLTLPAAPITLEEKRAVTQLLLKSGATIHEMNTVRKHLSRVKGGNLARAARSATVVNLVISDVVGDNLDVIASGPFAPDTSTFGGALEILERYGIADKAPASVLERIRAGARGEIEENPGPGNPAFARVTDLIVASNIIALEAAKKEAVRRGYNSIILSSGIEGDTADAAFWHSRIARETLISSNPVPPPACIISGGETTVAVSGDGLGGRNMEFAMRSAVLIDGFDRIAMASIGTDGTDGPTDAAGAVVDGSTIRISRNHGMDINDYISRNDSYHFHQKLGSLIKTGPTNTNVMDIRLIIVT